MNIKTTFQFLPDQKVFDMKKFEANVNRELSRAYPDRRRLEQQCLSAIAFVKSETDVLDCPIWIMIVNVVAMDMLKTKLPPGMIPIPSFYPNYYKYSIRYNTMSARPFNLPIDSTKKIL
jgi:hypothetical protein